MLFYLSLFNLKKFSFTDKLKKKKKKDKERDKEKSRDKDRRKDEKHLKSGDKKDGSFSSDRKDSSHNSRKDSSMPVNRHNSLSSEGSQKDGDATVEDNPENSRDSLGSGSGVDKNNFRGKECDEDDRTKRKPKTVRVFTNKFRSVFEDDDPLPPIKKKTPDELKASIPIVKRNRLVVLSLDCEHTKVLVENEADTRHHVLLFCGCDLPPSPPLKSDVVVVGERDNYSATFINFHKNI